METAGKILKNNEKLWKKLSANLELIASEWIQINELIIEGNKSRPIKLKFSIFFAYKLCAYGNKTHRPIEILDFYRFKCLRKSP